MTHEKRFQIEHRQVKYVAAFALLIASVWIGIADTSAAIPKQKPNVLFIAIDDLNDWVGCLAGHPQARTPNIDRLARRGTLFTNAHCQGPICGPSRASLLSGLYPHTTGVYQQPGGKAMANDKVHFQGKMLPEYFARHGYKTMAVGKITHGYPANKAFQIYAGKFAGSGPKPQRGKRFNFHLPNVPYTGTQTDWGAFPESDDLMPDHKSADWAVEQLAKKHGKPFFMGVGFIRPHVPFYVPKKWFDLFPLDKVILPPVRSDDLDDVPTVGRLIHELPKYPRLDFLQKNDNEQFRKCVQAYLACTTFVDHQVGKVLDALQKGPHAENTAIIVFSDHGYHLGEKDRVSKHSLWEESTRVPLVIVPPKSNKTLAIKAAGQRCALPTGLIDIYPTLLDLASLPANPSNEGASLVPFMASAKEIAQGAMKTPWRFATLTTYAKGNHALRSARFRYIRYDDGKEELYDHELDPHEWTNLAKRDTHQKVIQQFKKSLPKTDAKYHKATRSGAVNKWFKNHLKKNGIE